MPDLRKRYVTGCGMKIIKRNKKCPMLKKKEILTIIRLIEECYPEPVCALTYTKDYELLFAARLSAQCTDSRVNTVTPELFKKYPTLEAVAAAETAELENIIHPCGFYRIKARDIIAAAAMLISDFEGKVPDTMEKLLKLPGVGRKTANLMLGDIHGKPAIVVDTHCIRLTNRIGFVNMKDPEKIETALRDLLPPECSTAFCHRMVLHGRVICTARNPKCGICCLNTICRYMK